MPRPSKGPRLYLDPAERVWIIRDGSSKRRTGCREDERDRATQALAEYITEKYQPVRDNRPDRLHVEDVLTFYLREIAPGQKASATSAYAAQRLLDWWSGKKLSDVKRSTCQQYVAFRVAQPRPQAKTDAAKARRVSMETVRRELTVLRAAINAYHAENMLDAVPTVTLPPAAPPRSRWLTRGEVAAFIRAARSHPDKDASRALIRFTLLGVYTGTRSGAVRDLQWMPSTIGGWVDVVSGVIHRRPEGSAETRKRRPPVKIPRRLLGHLRRWKAIDEADPGRPRHVVHYEGNSIESQKKCWHWCRDEAGLGPEVIPHILRHTAATWLMQAGGDPWEVSGYLGMSHAMLCEVYGHHHPDFQRSVADRIGRKPA